MVCISWITSLLTQGIDVECSGTLKRFYGSLVAFIGDTPAAGLVGGFKEGVGGSYRPCRTCMITTDKLCSKVLQCMLLYYVWYDTYVI